MENENMVEEQFESTEETKSGLHTITPLSKYLAMVLFVILPFLGGWIGYMYAPEKVLEVEKVVIVEKNVEAAVAIATAQSNAVHMEALLRKQTPDDTDTALFQTLAAAAIDAGGEATALEPNNPDAWAAIGNIYSIGVTAGISDSYEQASEYLTKAKQLDPDSAVRYLDLARLEARNANYNEAEIQIDTAVNLDSNNADVLFVAADIAIAQEKYDEAVDLINASIAIEPENPLRYEQLGAVESARGNTETAIAAYETAVEIEPNDADIQFTLGYLYFVTGRLAEAEQKIQTVIDMNDQNAEATELLKQIQEAQQAQ